MKIKKVKLKKEDLNEEYITSHADIVSWRHVSLSMNLESFSDSFYERFHRELKWKWIIYNKSITTEFAHNYQKELKGKFCFKEGKRHREDGPAVVLNNGTKEWWIDGEKHRGDDLPAVENIDGTREWWFNGQQHRENGPSVKFYNGNYMYFVNDSMHRVGGPAAVFGDYSEWRFRGELHNENGPAVINPDTGNEWYVHGEEMSEEEFLFLKSKRRKRK